MLPRVWNGLLVSMCLCGVACSHSATRKNCGLKPCHQSAIPPHPCGKTALPVETVLVQPTVPKPPATNDARQVILPPAVKLSEIFRPTVLPPFEKPEAISKYHDAGVQQPFVAPPTVLAHPTPEEARIHADDYSWIIGELEYLHMKKQWRVRYASCASGDPHGGVVTLRSIYHITEPLKEGALVRVRGKLIESSDRRESAEYYVHELKVMK